MSESPAVSAEPAHSLAQNSSRPWILAATVAAMLISAIEGTIMATVMPTIVGVLGGFDLFSWTFTAYLLTQAVTIPIYGRLADLYGRKRVLLIAIAIFLAGSILCGFAWSMLTLIAFRVLQGIGAGGIVPIAQTIVGDLYTPAERARIQGYLSSVWGAGAIIGPLVGAFLVAHTIWPMVFWVNVPVGAIAAALLIFRLHEKAVPRQHRIDYLGSALMMLATGVLMFALVDVAKLATGTMIALIAAAGLLLALFIFHEQRTPEPMLPLALWRNRIIASGNFTSLLLGAVMMGSTAFLSLYVQSVMGRAAIVAGAVLAAPSICWPIGSSVGGRLMLRTSYRATALTGSLPFLCGSLMMIALAPGRGPLWAAVGSALIGIGMGFTSNTYQVAIQSTVGWSQRGVATSSLVFTRIIGQALGAAIFGGLLNAGLAGAIAGGGNTVDRIMDPALRDSLPPDQIRPLMMAVDHGLHNVYLIIGLLVLMVLVAGFGLPPHLSPIRAARGAPLPQRDPAE